MHIGGTTIVTKSIDAWRGRPQLRAKHLKKRAHFFDAHNTRSEPVTDSNNRTKSRENVLDFTLSTPYTQIVYSHQRVDCMNGVELIFDENAKGVFLCLNLDATGITQQDVMRDLAASGYAQFLVHADFIDSAIAQHDAAPVPTDNGATEVPHLLAPVMIAEKRDALVNVQLDDSRMTATLCITAPWGGVNASVEHCVAALEAAGVTYGIDNSAIAALVMQAGRLDHGSTIASIAARGTAPQAGHDSPFEVLVSTLKDRILHPHENADGSIDFHELGDIPVVKAGEPVMRRLPAGTGIDGMNVCGEITPAPHGQCLAFNIGQGTQLCPTDPDLLIAQWDGMPVQWSCGMSVEKVFRTGEVSVKTGNVSFGGSILVDKDVSTGFAVRADTDITVAGTVESARLIAGHDIMVPGGISGNLAIKGTAPSAFISAGNLLCAGFAQFAELHANVGVSVGNFMLHCEVTSFDWIKAGGDNPGKSRIIGGALRALSYIKVDTLGAPNGTSTRVELHGNFERMSAERETLEKRIAEREHQLQQVEIIAATLKTKTRFPHHAEMVQRTQSARRNLSADLEQTRQALAAWQHKHQHACETIRLVITRKAHAGVEIIIGDKRVLLTEDWGPGTVQYGSQGLVFQRGKLLLAH